MGVKEVTTLLLERGMAMQTFWGFYITISLGLIVFFGNAKRSKRLPYLAGLVSIGFIAFAYVNCSGMLAISAQRNFLYGILGSLDYSGIVPVSMEIQVARGFVQLAKPDTPEAVEAFHVVADIAVLGAIWFLALWKAEPDAGEDILNAVRTLHDRLSEISERAGH